MRFQNYEENTKICTRQNNEKSIYAIQSNIAQPCKYTRLEEMEIRRCRKNYTILLVVKYAL